MRFAHYLPTIAFVLAVMGARFSGNDKAPFLVMLVLVLNLLWVVAMPVLRKKIKFVLIAAVPLIYTAAVIGLSRCCGLDTMIFLGFR